MKFGDRIRDLRKAKCLGQRALAELIGTSFTYISKIENQRLDFGEYPSEAMIHKLAEALDANETELLVLAEKVPQRIRQRVFQRPEAFMRIADLDDQALDAVLKKLPASTVKSRQVRRSSK